MSDKLIKSILLPNCTDNVVYADRIKLAQAGTAWIKKFRPDPSEQVEKVAELKSDDPATQALIDALKALEK